MSIRPVPRARIAAALALATAASAGAAPAPLIPTDTAHVVHATAVLRDTPDLAAAPHGALARHDVVHIVDRRRAPQGWLEVRYAAKDGTTIERWARIDDFAMGLEPTPAR